MDKTAQHIAALIFSTDSAITIKEIQLCLGETLGLELNEDEITDHINSLIKEYNEGDHSFEIVNSGGGYQFLTKSTYGDTVAAFLKQKSKRKLSTAALESLAIIAYKQPVTKSEVEKIRGVNCDYTLHKLLEKELIEIAGKSKSPGRPLLYTTSTSFLDYFGINSVEELPKLKDIHSEANEVGEASA